MEHQVKSEDGNMNIEFLKDIIHNSNFLQSTGAALLCFATNLFAFDTHLIISSATYVMSFCGAGMALYNSYLSIQIRKQQLKEKQKRQK